MNKRLAAFGLLFIAVQQLYAQVLPAEGSKLSYRLIGFSVPKDLPGSQYQVEIAGGTYNDTNSFIQNKLTSFSGDKNRIIGMVPAFGRQYTWRAVISNGAKTTTGELHHFSTMMSRVADTTVTRVRITTPAAKHKDDYVLLDATHGLYDMNGNLLWFLPETDLLKPDSMTTFGDLRTNSQGTLTFLTSRTEGHACEVNYNGKLLWQGPNTGAVSGDSLEHYHHELIRLPNGHYMVMGDEYVSWRLPSTVDSRFMAKRANQKRVVWDSVTKAFYEKMHFGTLIEYDAKGKVVWSWKSSKYFKGADVFSRTAPHGAYYVNDVHSNGFYFDKKAKGIYVSFKGVSRVLKIKYPEGTVMAVYGKKYDHGDTRGHGPDLFVQQHNCMISKEGYLYLFNNNDRMEGALPTLIMMQQPLTKKDTLKRVWEYECTIDGLDSLPKQKISFSTGGNVFEMPDGDLFASMSAPQYTKMFIVSRNKEVLWSALPEAWNPLEKKWNAIFQYKASIISRAQLEQLIWSQ